jgi:hypothetical protein
MNIWIQALIMVFVISVVVGYLGWREKQKEKKS